MLTRRRFLTLCGTALAAVGLPAVGHGLLSTAKTLVPTQIGSFQYEGPRYYPRGIAMTLRLPMGQALSATVPRSGNDRADIDLCRDRLMVWAERMVCEGKAS